MKRPKHPHKDIEAVIRYAEDCGWRYKPAGSSSHAWGRLFCPLASREGGCILSIWCTPHSAETHATQIMQALKHCSHYGVFYEKLH